MKSRVLLLVLPVAMMLTACQPATTELTDEQKAAIEVEFKAFTEDVVSSVLDVDAEGFLNFFDNSADFTLVMGGSVFRSWQSWAEMVRGNFSQLVTVESCDVSDEGVQVLAEDVVVYTADWVCSCTVTEDGPTMDLIDHTVTGVAVKRDGEWTIVNFTETVPQAASEG